MNKKHTKKFNQQDLARLKEAFLEFYAEKDIDVEWVRLMNHRTVLLLSSPGDYFAGTIEVPLNVELAPLVSEELYHFDDFLDFGFNPYQSSQNCYPDINEETA